MFSSAEAVLLNIRQDIARQAAPAEINRPDDAKSFLGMTV